MKAFPRPIFANMCEGFQLRKHCPVRMCFFFFFLVIQGKVSLCKRPRFLKKNYSASLSSSFNWKIYYAWREIKCDHENEVTNIIFIILDSLFSWILCFFVNVLKTNFFFFDIKKLPIVSNRLMNNLYIRPHLKKVPHFVCPNIW